MISPWFVIWVWFLFDENVMGLLSLIVLEILNAIVLYFSNERIYMNAFI